MQGAIAANKPVSAAGLDGSGPVGCPSTRAEAFYTAILHELLEARLPFLVAGGYAVNAYTGLGRPTKDLDIFTTAGVFPRVLLRMKQRGYAVKVEDERWIGKVHKGDDFIDIIFGSANGAVPVQEDWFAQARQAEILGTTVPMLSPTELIWSKAFVQDRRRFDGSDVIHVILKQHDEIDWRRLLSHMDGSWEILLGLLTAFRWVYPSERNVIPRWLLEELMARLERQLELPPSERRVCRGGMFSSVDYRPAVEQWGFADIAT
jgi:hypothetical protein